MLVLLSPVLKALTRATTSDTIWTLAGVLLAFNALLADYTAEKRSLRPAEGCVCRFISALAQKW